jgi:hypothetical protein
MAESRAESQAESQSVAVARSDALTHAITLVFREALRDYRAADLRVWQLGRRLVATREHQRLARLIDQADCCLKGGLPDGSIVGVSLVEYWQGEDGTHHVTNGVTWEIDPDRHVVLVRATDSEWVAVTPWSLTVLGLVADSFKQLARQSWNRREALSVTTLWETRATTTATRDEVNKRLGLGTAVSADWTGVEQLFDSRKLEEFPEATIRVFGRFRR